MTFGNTDVFNEALQGRYGKATDIKDYIAKAQAQNYESHRAMMEAYGLHKYHTATGVVQWMGSNPWPGLIWHTYDYYLYPAGTYYGMRKSMEPLHIMYSYANNEVDITNSLLQKFSGLKAKADIYNLDGRLKYSNHITTGVEPDSIQKCFVLPRIDSLSDTYFLRLQLSDVSGEVKSINWYWLSKKPDELDWVKSKWYMTPQTAYTDFSALQNIAPTSLKMLHTTGKKYDSSLHTIIITNTGKTVAFQTHIRVVKSGTEEDILPVLFSDNYFELAPGETRTITCSYANKDAKDVTPEFITTAWNLDLAKCKATGKVRFEALK